MAAAMSRTILRSPNELVRTLPATVNVRLCLMLRRFQKRGRGADYINRFFPFMGKYPAKPGDGAVTPLPVSSPFMGKYPAKPGDGAGSPPNADASRRHRCR